MRTCGFAAASDGFFHVDVGAIARLRESQKPKTIMKLNRLTGLLTAAVLFGLVAGASALTQDDADAILFMKQEEKLARDVYRTLYAKWGVAIFANIASSEQQHMNAVSRLIARYKLNDPTPAAPGKFTYPELQKLHDQLVVQGSSSLKNALAVGVAIEKEDIADLREAIAATREQPIKKVFSNLLRGSLNHLAAFTRWLK